jgi:hypothetical protein
MVSLSRSFTPFAVNPVVNRWAVSSGFFALEVTMAKPPRYEGSPADNRKDSRLAKKAGVSRAAFEKTKLDRKLDAAGQKKLNARFRSK